MSNELLINVHWTLYFLFIVQLLFGCQVATLKLSATIVPSQHREAPWTGTTSSRHTTWRLPSTCVRALCESRASNCAGRKRDAQRFSSSCATQRTRALDASAPPARASARASALRRSACRALADSRRLQYTSTAQKHRRVQIMCRRICLFGLTRQSLLTYSSVPYEHKSCNAQTHITRRRLKRVVSFHIWLRALVSGNIENQGRGAHSILLKSGLEDQWSKVKILQWPLKNWGECLAPSAHTARRLWLNYTN